jgi:probable biosynthetic protein (TIGR04098 family)
MNGVTDAARIVMDPNRIRRAETVRPAISGSNGRFFGHVGDWTWDTVAAHCDTDVLRATDAEGRPTYLSFFYFRIRSAPGAQAHRLAFGDRLHTHSAVYDEGPESVLALHRISREAPEAFDLAEFYRGGAPDTIYVETFNRWVGRGGGTGNEDLRSASPATFRHAHLPAVPPEHSPRRRFRHARTHGRFAGGGDAADLPPLRIAFPVDPITDINAAGLLYFAGYFNVIDRALLRWWRSVGRPEETFADRTVAEHELCYFGNANADATVTVDVAPRRDADTETVDMRITDDGRLLAVSTLRLALKGPR